MAKRYKFFGYYTTLAIVGANRVGTGVFATLGLRAIDALFAVFQVRLLAATAFGLVGESQ